MAFVSETEKLTLDSRHYILFYAVPDYLLRQVVSRLLTVRQDQKIWRKAQLELR
jgi:hypothetical protein